MIPLKFTTRRKEGAHSKRGLSPPDLSGKGGKRTEFRRVGMRCQFPCLTAKRKGKNHSDDDRGGERN